MLRAGFERALLSMAQMPIVPILFGFEVGALELLRSADGEVEVGLLLEMRLELAGVRPRTVRPP